MSRIRVCLIAGACVLGVLPLARAGKPAQEAPLKGFLLVAERPRPQPGQTRPTTPGAAGATTPSGSYGPGAPGGAAPAGGGGEIEGIIGIIDVEANKEVARIPEGGIISHMVTVAPEDSNFAFVPIYGTGGVGTPGTDGSKISVIDLVQKKLVDSIDLGHGARPHQSFFNPKDGLLYVTTERDYALTIIDPKTRKKVGAIPTGQPESHDFVFSPDYKRAYTVNVFAGTISVLDVENRKLLNIVPVVAEAIDPNAPGGGGGGGGAPAFRTMMVQRISITPDGKYVFTQDQRHQALAMLDTKSLKVVGSVPLPQRGLGSNVTPDGKYALAVGNDQVSVVDIKEQKVIKNIPVGRTPQEIFIRPDGKWAYVTANNSGYVTGIKLADWSTIQLNIGETNAEGMAWWYGPK